MGPTNSPLPTNLDVPDFNAPAVGVGFTDEERVLAAVADGDGWKQVKAHLNDRINYFQQFTPGGKAISELEDKQLIEAFKVADAVIAEFRVVITTIEGLNEAIKTAR